MINLIILFILNAYAQQDFRNEPWVDNAQRLCEIVPIYGAKWGMTPSISNWPTVQYIPNPPYIVPGTLAGLSVRTATIVVVCSVLKAAVELDINESIYGSKGALNSLTDGNWGRYQRLQSQYFDIKAQAYDSESGKFRKAALKSKRLHRDLNSFYKDSYGLYNRTVNRSDAELRTRGERERDMARLASVANRRAILQEATNCPVPKGNTDYERFHKLNIEPKEHEVDDLEDDIKFFKSQMYKMGVKISNQEKDLEEYISEFEKMITTGTNYDVKITKKKEETSVNSPTRVDREGKPVVNKKSINTSYQTFSVKEHPEIYEAFKHKYGKKWQEWVSIQVASRGARGLFADPRGNIEDEFRDIKYECMPRRLMRGVPTSRADYSKLRDERVQKCKEETQVNQKQAEGLLNYYVDQIKTTTKKLKDNNAYIWTQESDLLGIFRAVGPTTSADGFVQEEVKCAETNNMSPAFMREVEIKQQAVQAEYKEFILEQYKKKTELMRAELNPESAYVEEMQKRREFAETLQREQQHQNSNSSSIMGIKGTP